MKRWSLKPRSKKEKPSKVKPPKPKSTHDRSIKETLKLNFLPLTFLIYGLVVVSIGVFLIIGNWGPGMGQEDALNNLDYINSEYGFGLNSPNGWALGEASTGGIVRYETHSEEEYLISFDVTVAPCLPEQSLELFGGELLQLFEANPNCSIISNNNRIINGRNAYEMVVVMAFDTMDVKQKYVLMKKDTNVFTQLYSAPLQLYDAYLSAVEESIRSFTLI